jgi:lipopolysaccharide heptosyltransferase II
VNQAGREPLWRNVRRVLVVRLDNLGDVLMTTPAIAAIRAGLPDVHLALLASRAGAAVARFVPEIDQIIEFEPPWMKASSACEDGALGSYEAQMIARLAAARFDAALIFTVCTQSALPAALLCRLAGIPLRLAHSRENPYGLLTDWVSETDRLQDGMRHEVARQLALAGSVGFHVADDRLRLQPATADFERAREELHACGVPSGQPYFVVHPGASAASRRYPAERFGIAAEAIARRSGCTAVFTGDASEAPLVETARSAMAGGSSLLVGKLGVGALAALIAESRLLIANNTGPAHIAAAMGTPVVVLYALTNPQHTPWKVRSRVLYHPVECRYCLKSVCPEGHHDCLRKVKPETVVDAALELLQPQEVAA